MLQNLALFQFSPFMTFTSFVPRYTNFLLVINDFTFDFCYIDTYLYAYSHILILCNADKGDDNGPNGWHKLVP